MAELSAGVRALVGRMESNPSEFYGEAEKWRFMFSANFRDVLTEPEKGALHEGLKEVRRKEFDEKVMRELLKDNMENQIKEGYYTSPQISSGGTGFGMAQIKAQGATVGYDDTVDSLGYSLTNSSAIGSTNKTLLKLGKETLSEEDVKQMKAATTSSNLFK
jgi:hypothetical protein